VIRIGNSIPLLSGGSLASASVGSALSRTVVDVLRAERFDVLHAHSPLMPTLPLLSLRASDCANVGTFHSDFERNVLYFALARFLQPYLDRLDAAIGVSETALRGLRRYFRAPWRVIPNGVDVSMFSSGQRRPEFDDERLNVLHVGRFDPRNGVDRVIKAWVGVRRAGTDARLILVGDGPLHPTYESMIPPDLRADTHFVGFVPEVTQLKDLGDKIGVPSTLVVAVEGPDPTANERFAEALVKNLQPLLGTDLRVIDYRADATQRGGVRHLTSRT
jgi:phosphatidylinositol alpha-mannosyltransferase